VPYVDHLISDREPSSELDAAVSRVFWRGNLKQTCEDSLADGAQMLLDLQEECVAAADGTGNPDACTECVYRAEALIPECGPIELGHGHVKDSKCSSLQTYNVLAPPTGLPAWWFDNTSRTSGDVGFPQNTASLCAAPFYVATQWCTGTGVYRSTGTLNPQVVTDTEIHGTIPCNSGTLNLGIYGIRRGGFLFEPALLEKGPILFDQQTWEYANGPWLPPMITAYREEQDVEVGENGGCNPPKVTSSLEQIIHANIPLADATEYRELDNTGANIPYCGLIQRSTYWFAKNADCSTTAGVMGYQPRQLDTLFNDTGEYINEYDTSDGKTCLLKEPRKFQSTCSDGLATCNAGWQCVDGQGLPFVRRISPIDQEEADRFK
jgi:hypothetical protein